MKEPWVGGGLRSDKDLSEPEAARKADVRTPRRIGVSRPSGYSVPRTGAQVFSGNRCLFRKAYHGLPARAPKAARALREHKKKIRERVANFFLAACRLPVIRWRCRDGERQQDSTPPEGSNRELTTDSGRQAV